MHRARPSSADGGSPPVRGVGRLGLAVRLAVVTAALAVLLLGQLHHTDDYFPLGSMAMFAQARDPEGIVDDTCVQGRFEGDTEPTRLAFGSGGVGVARSDLEGNLPRAREDPSGLRPLAEEYARHHPGAPPPRTIAVCVDRYRPHQGGPSGPPEHLVLVEWTVR